MSAEEADPTGTLAAREIVSTRVAGAARDLAFKAFTDPIRRDRTTEGLGFGCGR